MKKNGYYLLFAAILALVVMACQENDSYTSNASYRLSFTADTVSFDTVFTAIGSSTQVFQVHNRHKQGLRIARITLAGGTDSPFRVNVDGLSGTAFSEVELRARDSMFVFVEVTVDPHDSDSPIEVNDSLQFVLESGIVQQVQLRAIGRDVVVMKGVTLTENTVLDASRPYLIYDSLRVDSGYVLELKPGAKLYFHNKAQLLVHGTVLAMGDVDHPIVFRGDRTDRMFSYLPYDRISGQWGGIHLYEESTGNIFYNCDIHSAEYGVKADPSDWSNLKLLMQNTQIHNMKGNGLDLSMVTASFINCLFSNAGGDCVRILGGKMDFIHCTLANFYPWKAERGVALNINNAKDQYLYPLMGVNFVNCVITGSKDDEIVGLVAEKTDSVDYSQYAQYGFSFSLVNSSDKENAHFTNITWESADSVTYQGTNFRQINHSTFDYDFHLDSLSMARGIASMEYASQIPFDKDGNDRTSAGKADAGCFQFLLR